MGGIRQKLDLSIRLYYNRYKLLILVRGSEALQTFYPEKIV